MSRVTNIILAISAGGGVAGDDQPLEPVKKINRWLEQEDQPQLFIVPRESVAGTKSLEVDIFLGAYNHLPVEGFTEAVSKAGWESGTTVQLLIKEQDDDTFRTRYHLEVPF